MKRGPFPGLLRRRSSARVRAFLLVVCVALSGACAAASAGRASSASVVLDARAAYPEGPLWHDGRLYVAEMGADLISVFQGGRKGVYWTRDGCGPTSLAPYGAGFAVLCHISAQVVILDAHARVVRVIDRDDRGRRFRDPNDSSADGAGGVYFSDPGPFSRDTRPEGAVVHLAADGEVRRVLEGLWYPNGVLVDRGRRLLYVSEMLRHRLLRYAIGENGSLRETGVFDFEREAPPKRVDLPAYREWGPDGLDFAPNGDLLAAIYGHGRIVRLSRDLRYLGETHLPTRFVTNLAFGAAGEVYTTGAFDNEQAPFPGEVRRWEGAGFAVH
jgi:gluconolactonase